jgi:hypothetical protein
VSASPSYLFTTNPAPDYEIESNANITKTWNMETTYEKELFRQIREGVQTPEDLFARLAELRILDETRMRALAVREWIKQQNPVLIHGRPKKGACHTNGLVNTMWQAAEHFKCSYEAIRKYWYYYTDVNL